MNKARKYLEKHGIKSGTITVATAAKYMKLYADEQKKKEAKDFAHWIVMNQDKIKLGQTYIDFYGELYNEWKSNQEEQG